VGFGVDAAKKKVLSISVCYDFDDLFPKQTKRTNKMLTLPLCAAKKP